MVEKMNISTPSKIERRLIDVVDNINRLSVSINNEVLKLDGELYGNLPYDGDNDGIYDPSLETVLKDTEQTLESVYQRVIKIATDFDRQG